MSSLHVLPTLIENKNRILLVQSSPHDLYQLPLRPARQAIDAFYRTIAHDSLPPSHCMQKKKHLRLSYLKLNLLSPPCIYPNASFSNFRWVSRHLLQTAKFTENIEPGTTDILRRFFPPCLDLTLSNRYKIKYAGRQYEVNMPITIFIKVCGIPELSAAIPRAFATALNIPYMMQEGESSPLPNLFVHHVYVYTYGHTKNPQESLNPSTAIHTSLSLEEEHCTDLLHQETILHQLFEEVLEKIHTSVIPMKQSNQVSSMPMQQKLVLLVACTAFIIFWNLAERWIDSKK